MGQYGISLKKEKDVWFICKYSKAIIHHNVVGVFKPNQNG